MINAIEAIEQKVSGYQEDLKKKNVYLGNINDALKKLSHDREVTISEINALQGVIHGYSESSRLMKEQMASNETEKLDG
jgi:hypothetical protein